MTELSVNGTGFARRAGVRRQYLKVAPKRMRAAIALLPHQHPKLAVTQTTGNIRDFAAQLEAARKRSGRGGVIEHQTTVPLAPEVLEPIR